MARETNFPLSISLPYCAINYSPRNLLPRGCRIRLGWGVEVRENGTGAWQSSQVAFDKMWGTLTKKIVDCEN